MRRVADIAVLALTGAILCETWILGGLFPGYTVSAGSMAPTLLGPHSDVTCPRCRAPFPVDWRASRDAETLRCPDCGFTGRRGEFEFSPEKPGDRVFLHRMWLTLGERPQRWEPIAFRHPENPRKFVVKRVVGLPGEEVSLRDGDVYIDGKIARKSLEQFLAMAVPVCRWSAASGLDASSGPGWFTSSNPTGWTVRGDDLVWEPESHAGDPKPVDWLQFRPQGSARPGPILDDFSYNFGLPRRVETVNPVADIGVSLCLKELSKDAVLRIRLVSRADSYEIRIDRPAGMVRFFRNERSEQELPILRNVTPYNEVVFTVFDRRVVASVDGIQILEYDISNPPEGVESHPPVALCIASGKCILREIRVFRDAHYDRPCLSQAHSGPSLPTILGEDSYYCLGDNSDISDDSRTWRAGPELPASLIVGRPVFAISAGGGQSASGMIPVPKPAHIHYIH